MPAERTPHGDGSYKPTVRAGSPPASRTTDAKPCLWNQLRHIDILSDGSYFIAPGSVGKARGYAWVKGKNVRDVKLANLPKAWEAKLRKGPVNDAPVSEAHQVSPAEGSRNTTLTSMAGAMRRGGMSGDAIAAALLAENARCNPPLDDGEVRAIAASICSLYPEGGNTTDPALQLVGSVLASDFAGGRHVILEQDRFWIFNGTHWERVSDAWIKSKVLAAIPFDQKFKGKKKDTTLFDRIAEEELALGYFEN
jgi:hypothetical protein